MPLPVPPPQPTTLPATADSHKPREYKVIKQARKETMFSGEFDLVALEDTMNSYAKQGWRVLTVISTPLPGRGGGSCAELLIVLER
jgi:hypothetical protein